MTSQETRQRNFPLWIQWLRGHCDSFRLSDLAFNESRQAISWTASMYPKTRGIYQPVFNGARLREPILTSQIFHTVVLARG